MTVLAELCDSYPKYIKTGSNINLSSSQIEKLVNYVKGKNRGDG